MCLRPPGVRSRGHAELLDSYTEREFVKYTYISWTNTSHFYRKLDEQ